MERRGRKPLATKHVDRLEGSEVAKLRLRVILETLRGELTIPAACRELQVCESRFHALRQQWMQEAVELLEPRPAGRPAKERAGPREEELLSEKRRLQEELAMARTEREVAEIMAIPLSRSAAKKKRAARERLRRAAQRRPR